MSKHTSRTALSLALGTGLIALSGAQPVTAGENPFVLNPLQSGYKVVAEAKCGAEKKPAEAKCGAEKKAPEAKCGAEKKAGETQCGAEKKAAESKCGEAKCGGKK